jgi:hypothetical protein
MSEQTVRKTCQYNLRPTPQQERELGRVLGLCRWLYNTEFARTIVEWGRPPFTHQEEFGVGADWSAAEDAVRMP